MQQIESNKNKTIQIMRGLAIILVLIRHSLARVNTDIGLKVIEQIIICIHMPTFFVISGYLFQKQYNKYVFQGKKSFVIKKVKHLMVPYIFWSVLLWIGVQIVWYLGGSIQNVMITVGFESMSIKNLIYGLLTYGIYYTEHLWFLYVLFIYFIIHIIIGDFGKNVVALITSLILGLLSIYIESPYIVGKCLLWLVFFTCGRYVGYHNEILVKVKSIKESKHFINVLILFILCSFIRIFLVSIEYNNGILYIFQLLFKYLIGFLGTWIVYAISSKINESNLKEKVAIIGDYSYDIYLIHNPYFVAISSILINKILGISSYIAVAVATIIGIYMPITISKLIIRRYSFMSKVMIGKEKDLH